MKEQLEKVKEGLKGLSDMKKEFHKQRDFFNLKVEEMKKETGVEECYYAFTEDADSYIKAVVFFDDDPCDIIECVEDIKADHPKYGEKRIKELAVNKIVEQEKMEQEECEETFRKFIEEYVNMYYLYVNCGFLTVKAIEDAIRGQEESIKADAGDIFNESKETVAQVGAKIGNVVRPYGEVAKGQLKSLSNSAKSVVHSGSKKLIKILDKVVTKTETKEEEK